MLTRKQDELFEFLKLKLKSSRVAPSCEEMARAMNLKSKSGIIRLLDGLEERGYIRRIAKRARAIEIIRRDFICPHCGYPAGGEECVRAARIARSDDRRAVSHETSAVAS